MRSNIAASRTHIFHWLRQPRTICAALLLALCLPSLTQAATPVPVISEFPTLPLSNANSGGLPVSVTTGADGNLWFVQRDGRIGRMTQTGAVTIFSGGISTLGSPSQTSAITAGPDGNLWFTESAVDKIGMITLAGVVTEYAVSPGAQPTAIAAGADGNLWFTETNHDSIGRITPAGVLTEFSTGISAGSAPVGIAAGGDGNLWFSELRGPRMARITPQGRVTEFAAGLVAPQLPAAVAAGPDGNLWFTDLGMNQIGRITPTGAITLFSAGISPNAQINGIAAGPDGNLWFTETGTGLIGRITTSGVVTEFASGITPNSAPLGITVGPDGNLWFAEYAASQIGRITTGAVVPQTGYWWNPAEAGRGFSIEQRGNNLFMGVFLYDISGRATWLAVGPGAVDGATFNGQLATYANGQTLTGAYKSPSITGSAGSFSVTFNSPTQATITWPGGTESIQRYYFSGSGIAAAPQSGAPESGLWWAPSEGGRGFAIEVQGNSLLLTGYMYDSAGKPIWYAAGPNAMLAPTAYAGTWEQFGNGQTLTGSYIQSSVVNFSVGPVSVQFSTTTSGVLTFPDGRQVAIQRFLF
jgi:streptogramin lyase